MGPLAEPVTGFLHWPYACSGGVGRVAAIGPALFHIDLQPPKGLGATRPYRCKPIYVVDPLPAAGPKSLGVALLNCVLLPRDEPGTWQ